MNEALLNKQNACGWKTVGDVMGRGKKEICKTHGGNPEDSESLPARDVEQTAFQILSHQNSAVTNNCLRSPLRDKVHHMSGLSTQ